MAVFSVFWVNCSFRNVFILSTGKFTVVRPILKWRVTILTNPLWCSESIYSVSLFVCCPPSCVSINLFVESFWFGRRMTSDRGEAPRTLCLWEITCIQMLQDLRTTVQQTFQMLIKKCFYSFQRLNVTFFCRQQNKNVNVVITKIHHKMVQYNLIWNWGGKQLQVQDPLLVFPTSEETLGKTRDTWRGTLFPSWPREPTRRGSDWLDCCLHQPSPDKRYTDINFRLV